MKVCIDKEINLKLKTRNVFIKNIDKEIKKILEKENYSINYINFQNNSINGVIKDNNKMYFFKILNRQQFVDEITGYMQIKEILPVSKIKEIFEFQNYCIIIFEYEKTISKNQGLLNDFFVKNDLIISDDTEFTLNKIINLYKKTFKKKIFKEEYPMQQFFKNRINSRLEKWYDNEKLLNYRVVINGMESIRTRAIINDCINFFNVRNKLECALTQGDPNTLNIGIKPIFFDFATAGYNPIICELVTIFWSVTIADAYFCPKYHKKSYRNHEKVFENIDKFSPNIKYTIDEKKREISIVSDIKTSKVRINFMEKYIKMLKELDFNITKDIIYFLTMRILCVFDIRIMEEKDYFYSIFILHYIYQNIHSDAYDSLEKIIKSFNLIK